MENWRRFFIFEEIKKVGSKGYFLEDNADMIL